MNRTPAPDASTPTGAPPAASPVDALDALTPDDEDRAAIAAIVAATRASLWASVGRLDRDDRLVLTVPGHAAVGAP